MQQYSYIRYGPRNKYWGIIDLTKFAYAVCQMACSVLIIYFCWYVQAYGNLSIVVNGSFLLMCGCIGMIWLCDGSLRTKDIPYGVWNQFLVIGYCLITGLFVAYEQSVLMESIRHYFIYIVFMTGICLVSANRKSYEWVLIAINISALICCIHLLGWGYHWDAKRIVLSSRNNPNLLGIILNLGLFSVLIRTKITYKSLALNIPQVCLILYNIIMTGSRKSLIVATMFLVFWFVSIFAQTLKKGDKKQKTIISIILICSIIAAIYFYRTFIVHTAVMDRMQTMGDEESNSQRIEMYKEAVEIFFNKPLFGGGLEQFGFWTGRGGYSHSTYAEAIADLGFVGSAIYFCPFVFAFFQAFKLSFVTDKSFRSRFALGFCVVEFFVAVGQIWFFEMAHFLAWTIIFLIITNIKDCENEAYHNSRRASKYVRN